MAETQQAARAPAGATAGRRATADERSRAADEAELGKVYDSRLMARLVRYLGPYRRWLALAALLLLAISALELAGPLLIKTAIDRYLAAADPAASGVAAALPAEALSGIDRIALLYLLVLVASSALRYAQTWALNLAGQRAMHDLRLAIFQRLERQSLSFFDRRPVGALITRLTNDVEALNEFLTSGLLAVVSDLLTLVGIAVALLLLDWRLALVTFTVLIPLVVITNLVRQAMRASFRAVRIRLGRLNAFLAESLSGIQVLQLFTREDRTRGEFRARDTDYLQANLRSVFYFSLFFPVVSLLSAVAIALVIWYGGSQVLLGVLTFGGLVAFIQYVERFFGPIRDLAEKINILQAAMAASERIFELLDEPVAIQDAPDAVEPPPFQGRIEFEDVWFAYEDENWVLRGLSFSVQPGERVALVGATGAGKTSIISLLSRLYEPRRGRILLDGVDVRRYRQADLRRRLAVVLQDPFLFAGTVARNIRLLNEEIDDARLRWAAEYVNAAPVIARLPDGYETTIHERGAGLSVGQKQLIAFARAIATQPEAVLVLDEATSSIDSETEAAIQDALLKLMAGRTSVIIAHRLSTIRHADRILVLHHGRLIEQGSHASLLAQGGQYTRLYELLYEANAGLALNNQS
jgi:ATP-binding cassette subfamily B protein